MGEFAYQLHIKGLDPAIISTGEKDFCQQSMTFSPACSSDVSEKSRNATPTGVENHGDNMEVAWERELISAPFCLKS